MLRHIISIFFLVLLSSSGFSQNFSITGTVKDKIGETLPGAGIYLSGYQKATVTNNDGKFALSNLKPGNYNILVEMMGFLPYTKNIIISDQSVDVEITLSENTIQLQEVIIRVDPNRERYINLFKDSFIGKSPNAQQCKILNPQVLIVDYDGAKKLLTVKSNDFLIIENKALGYRLKYMLQFFEFNFNSRIVYYSGLPNFEDLKGSGRRKKSWSDKREIAYYGSAQHFFKSLYKGTTKEEGFIINKLVEVKNHQRPTDSLIDANIKRLLQLQHGVIRLGSAVSDSLTYWSKIKLMPKKISTLHRAEVLTDTLVQEHYKNLKTMNYSDDLYLIYTKERESVTYTNNSGNAIGRPLDIPNYQISIVKLLEGPVHFYASGGIYQPKSLLYEGFWAHEKIADLVPIDYIPIANR